MKKRKIFVAFATLFVFMLNFQMAFAEGSSTKVTRSLEGVADNKVEYGDTKTLVFKQNNPIEVDIYEPPRPTTVPNTMNVAKDKEVIVVMDTSKGVSGPGENGGDPFGYALFSGSDNDSDYLLLTGNNLKIDGSAHSNSNMKLSLGASDLVVTNGTLNYYGNDLVTNDSTASWPTNKVDNKIDMPNLKNNFKTANAIRFSNEAYSTIYIGKKLYHDHLKPNSDKLLDIYGNDLQCNYNEFEEVWQINGNALYLNKETPYFFEGNLLISVDDMVGDGVIVATGSIQVDLGNATESDIGIYSVTGGIYLQLADGSTFSGLLYAPGHSEDGNLTFSGIIPGTINIQANSLKFYGSIVGKNLSLSGNKEIIYKETKVHDDFKEPDTDNIALDETKKKVIDLIRGLGEYSDSNVRFATIVYSDHAEIINSDFSTISSVEDSDSAIEIRNNLIEKINALSEKEGSNLGDGLRLAYNLFRRGEEEAEKYLVVFSNNTLDKYTVTPGTDNFRIDGVQLTEANISTDVKTNSEKAYEYAKEVAGIIKNEGYKGTYLVDVKPSNTDFDKFSEIGQVANAKKVGDLYCYNPELDDQGSFLGNLGRVVTEINTEIAIPDIEIVEAPDLEVIIPENFIDYDVEVKFGVVEESVLKYLNKIPDGVKFVSSDDLIVNESTGKLDFKEGFKSRIVTTKIDIDGIPQKLSITIPDLKVDVKFVKLGTFKFELAKLVYVLKSDGHPDIELPIDIEELEVTVEWPIDVN